MLTTASLALFQITLTPYASESGDLCQKPKEYYNKNAQLCCAACPPGERQIGPGVWMVVPWTECLSRHGEEGLQFSLGCFWGHTLIISPWAFTYDVPSAQHASPCLLLDNTYLHFRSVLLAPEACPLLTSWPGTSPSPTVCSSRVQTVAWSLWNSQHMTGP